MEESSPAIDAFRQCAEGFCQWCEGESLGDHPDRMAAVWLARLHAAALLLPPRDGSFDGESPGDSEGSDRAHKNLSRFLGDYYWHAQDPDPLGTPEVVAGDVGDDLLDTYRDIQAGLQCMAKGQVNDALWYWSFLHRTHWGQHAVGALAALHGRSGISGADSSG